MDTCIWIAVSLDCSLGTITTVLIGYTPIKNKKLKKLDLKKKKKVNVSPTIYKIEN